MGEEAGDVISRELSKARSNLEVLTRDGEFPPLISCCDQEVTFCRRHLLTR